MFANARLLVASSTNLAWINLATKGADQIATVALPILFVAQFGGDAGDTSILTIAATLPMLLFSLPIGAVADRSSLKGIVIRGELARLLSIAGMLVVLTIPSPPIALLALLAILGGTGTVAFQVAAPAIVARTTSGVERRKLNSNIEFARSLAITAGPPLAGFIVSIASGGIGLLVACILAATALSASTHLPRLPPISTKSGNSGNDLAAGFRFTLSNAWLRPILLISMLFNLGWYVIIGVIVAWADSSIGMTSNQIGLMFGVYGVGTIVGAAAVKRIGDAIPATLLVQIGPWCGLSFAGLILMSFQFPTPALLFTAFFLVGSGPMIWTITTMGIRQAVTPGDMMGRVSASIMMASAGSRPLGAGLVYVAYEFGAYLAAFVVAFAFFAIQAMLINGTALARQHVIAPLKSPIPAD